VFYGFCNVIVSPRSRWTTRVISIRGDSIESHLHSPHTLPPFTGRLPANGVRVCGTNSYSELVDPELDQADLRNALDEAMYASRAGFDAVAMTEHSQSSYDMQPNPDLAAAALAYATEQERLEVGIYTVGLDIRLRCEVPLADPGSRPGQAPQSRHCSDAGGVGRGRQTHPGRLRP
jgi:hypothetical protein